MLGVIFFGRRKPSYKKPGFTVVTPRSSTKHMSGRDFEDLGPSPWLEKKFGRAKKSA